MHTIHDNRNSDPNYVFAVHDNSDDYGTFDYLEITQKDGRRWLGQIVERCLNLPAMQTDPLHPTILIGLELAQKNDNIRTTKVRYVYKILLIGEISLNGIGSIRRGPEPGSICVSMTSEDLFQYLNLPAFNQDNQKSNAIGLIVNMGNAPLCWTAELFHPHVIVAGANGSGKSNLGANLIRQAVLFNKCIIVHDPKPDYGRMRESNTDPKVAHLWPKFAEVGLRPEGLANVYSIGFYKECNPEAVDRIIGLNASDFSATELANLLFYPDREENQYEAFIEAAKFTKDQNPNGFKLSNILDIVEQTPPDKLHEKTQAAILQKARRRASQFPWLDAIGQTVTIRNSPRRLRVERLDLDAIIAPDRVIHVSYSAGINNKSYGVLITYFFRMGHLYRSPEKNNETGIVQYVDEGQRIFEIEDARLIRHFDRLMREGRSRAHSMVLLVQSINQVPDDIITLLNTVFVMRQNSKAIARKAAETMGEDYAERAMGLQTGEALVRLHESRATMLVHCAPASFELERVDNRRRTRNLSDI